MKRIDDPYEISRIRKKVEDAGIDVDLKPTHYAIKIFPRNEQELNEIILLQDITVSQLPFEYDYLPKRHVDDLTVTGHDICYYEEEVRYFYSDDNRQDNPVPLPVLYVSWPVSLQLPEQYDYTIEYLACLPEFLGDEIDSTARSQVCNVIGTRSVVFYGYINDYDDLTNNFIPVNNLRLRLSYGLSSIDTYTDNNGFFVFSGSINTNATLKIIYENSKFRITNDSLLSIIEPYESVSTYLSAGMPTSIFLDSEALVIHRAANHFFYGNHAISTPVHNYSLRLNFRNANSQHYGSFNASPVTTPSIDIKLNDYYDDPNYVSNVLHELGHFNHYQRNGGFFNYFNVPSLIKESYANYVSWYLGRDYYTSTNNGVFNPLWEYSLMSSNQFWEQTYSATLGIYSPLFIDLYDDYNQKTSQSSPYNDDPISGIPHSVIPTLMEGCQTWQDFHNSLYNNRGVYYSYDDYVCFITPYDMFMINNSLL